MILALALPPRFGPRFVLVLAALVILLSTVRLVSAIITDLTGPAQTPGRMYAIFFLALGTSTIVAQEMFGQLADDIEEVR